MTSLSDVFKAYDIRGVVPDQLNAEQFRAIGVAVARFTGAPTLLVARDMRESGVELSGAFSDGARSEGVAVIDLGLASTDLLYFAAGSLDAPGAMFTASHNPAQYNGLKLCLSGARPIGRDTGLAEIQATAESLLDRVGDDGPPPSTRPDWRRSSSVRCSRPMPPTSAPSSTSTSSGPCGWWPTPPTAWAAWSPPRSSRASPSTCRSSSPSSTGTSRTIPADPIQPENLVALKQAVLDVGADVGLAFDGDADRVFLVDEQAEPVSGSLTTALVASSMLDKHPGSTVLYNCICSRVVPEVIAEQGGVGIRTKVGHSFIKQVMAETGADLRRRALGPLLLPGQLPGRLRHHRRHGRSRAAERHRPAALRAARSRSSATPTRGRSTPWSTTRPGPSS